MIDTRVTKLADILVNYSIKVQPGDWVVIRGDVPALPLFNEVVEKVIQAGGHPSVIIQDAQLLETVLKGANQEQLQWIDPLARLASAKADALMTLRAPENTRAFSGIPPEKQKIMSAANRELSQMFFERTQKNELRWVVTQYPCLALAQEANMSLHDYETFVYKATFVDQDDPVAAWQGLHDEQQKLVDWLVGKKQVQVSGPHVDLSLSINGRTFINSSGQSNMPSGEIFTGPVEDSVNGWIRFAYPAIANGREVEDVKLTFEDGKVVSARAGKNEDFLRTMLETDEGAKYLGEFAIGTNYGIQQFTKSMLYDEKIGGTIHVALGNGYPETGSTNKSAIHWDMLCDMRTDSEILVDGELFYKDGQFQI